MAITKDMIAQQGVDAILAELKAVLLSPDFVSLDVSYEAKVETVPDSIGNVWITKRPTGEIIRTISIVSIERKKTSEK